MWESQVLLPPPHLIVPSGASAPPCRCVLYPPPSHLMSCPLSVQVPTVLQTFFDERSGAQPAAMANLKLWQSLGIGAMFGLAQLNDLHLTALLLLVALVLSSASLLWVHTRIANLDSGKKPQGAQVASSSRPA